MKLIRNRQVAFVLQAYLFCALCLLNVGGLALEALSLAELADSVKA